MLQNVWSPIKEITYFCFSNCSLPLSRLRMNAKWSRLEKHIDLQYDKLWQALSSKFKFQIFASTPLMETWHWVDPHFLSLCVESISTFIVSMSNQMQWCKIGKKYSYLGKVETVLFSCKIIFMTIAWLRFCSSSMNLVWLCRFVTTMTIISRTAPCKP